jgi:hypothetical protein
VTKRRLFGNEHFDGGGSIALRGSIARAHSTGVDRHAKSGRARPPLRVLGKGPRKGAARNEAQLELSADAMQQIAAELDGVSRAAFSKRGKQNHVTQSNDEVRRNLIGVANMNCPA